MQSNILLWNKENNEFVRINEGTGDNLLQEDIREGYVDYIIFDFMEYDGMELTEIDGGQIMLTELYQEKFETVAEVVQYLLDTNLLPKGDYICLYAK